MANKPSQDLASPITINQGIQYYNTLNSMSGEILFKRVFIASDHGGFQLKQILSAYLKDVCATNQVEFNDLGCNSPDRVSRL